jgi:hypothetical protein
MKESELRALLRDMAERYSGANAIPPDILRQARSKLLLSVAAASVSVAGVLLAGALLLQGPGHKPATQLTKLPLAMDLVDYYDDGHHSDGESREEVHSREDADRHVACMRRHGFDLPDPTLTDRGWSVLVDDPRAFDTDSRAWREAAFVDCRPSPPPGPGNLIIGTELAAGKDISGFRECMRSQGFDLPIPERRGNEWVFDTSKSGLDFGSDRLHRALFVTCWRAP